MTMLNKSSLRRCSLLLICSLGLMPHALHARYTLDQAMTVAQVNGIDIAYTTSGPVDGPAVLMVMGLTGSHRLWGEDIVNGLADQGYQVVLFDNRDTGESARLDDLGTPLLWWELVKNQLGFDVYAPYSLKDMADDGVALLDLLGISRAHIVGASMGGMIAQIIAAEYPDRTRSLVSIMSTTGAPHLPQPEAQARDGLLGMVDNEGDAEVRLEAIGMYPQALPRQLMAIIAAGDRSEQVGSISAPTLVVHGAQDTLLKPRHGEHTHELIAGSKFLVYPEMGHNLPSAVVPQMVSAMSAHFAGAAGI